MLSLALGREGRHTRTMALSDSPEFWRSRAEETRTVAERLTDQQAKQSMFRAADEYERLAVRAESRLANVPPPK